MKMCIKIRKMDPKSLTHDHAKELLDAQAHIWNHIFNFFNSMALKCAIELGIPDAIHKHGQPITLSDLARALNIPTRNTESLNRLMRLLVHSNFFSKKKSPELGELVFDLTINSQLLLTDHPLSHAPYAHAVLDKVMVDPAHHLSTWLRNEMESPFHITQGQSLWEYAGCMDEFSDNFNQAMFCDSRFVARLMLRSDDHFGLFAGVESLVDVGGGNGTMAKAIGEVYPNLKCVVLDLAHVVRELQGKSGLNLEYVGGDMFAAIPQAQVVLLKSILHDWSDEHCLNILENCKKAIPSKENGGKVVIIDIIVVEDQNDINDAYSYTHIIMDIEMMSLTVGGKERTEQQWKKLFIDSGFDPDYKAFPFLGARSIIEVYPI